MTDNSNLTADAPPAGRATPDHDDDDPVPDELLVVEVSCGIMTLLGEGDTLGAWLAETCGNVSGDFRAG